MIVEVQIGNQPIQLGRPTRELYPQPHIDGEPPRRLPVILNERECVFDPVLAHRIAEVLRVGGDLPRGKRGEVREGQRRADVAVEE